MKEMSCVWPLIIVMLAYHLNESGQRWNAAFLVLFLVTQLIDVGVFAVEGRITEATCAFAGSKMAGDILLPSVGLMQQVLLVVFPQLPYRDPNSTMRPLSSFRFLSVTTHMFVLVSSLHSTACGQGKNEVVQALIYASILVYTVSLPAKVGGLFFVTFLSCSALLWRLCAIVDARAPAILRPVIYEGGAYCYLYAAVFLCEAHFSAWIDAAVSDRVLVADATDADADAEIEAKVPLPEFHAMLDAAAAGKRMSIPGSPHSFSLHGTPMPPCRYPVVSKVEQIASQQALAQLRLLHQEREVEADASPLHQEREVEADAREERPMCKFPVVRKQPPR